MNTEVKIKVKTEIGTTQGESSSFDIDSIDEEFTEFDNILEHIVQTLLALGYQKGTIDKYIDTSGELK